MEELEAFTWYGESGEPLRFADLTPAEQRTVMIAQGALLRGVAERRKASLSEVADVPLSAR